MPISMAQEDVIKHKIQRLLALRQEADLTFKNLSRSTDRSMSAEVKSWKNILETVDTVLLFTALAGGLVSIAKAGHKTLSKAGAELAAANKELLKSVVRGKKDQIRVLGELVVNESTEDPWIKFLVNFMSPSYWIGIAGLGHEQMDLIRKETINDIDTQRRLLLIHLDRKIEANHNFLRLIQRLRESNIA